MSDFVVELRHTINLDPDTKTFFATLIAPIIAGINHLETRMSAVDDAIAALGITADELKKDTERLIALFVAGGELTPEQQQAVDALQDKFAAIDAAVETAAPEA